MTSYLRNFIRCQALTGTDLFRPPYGSITKDQFRAIRRRSKVVMWDVLSGDFDTRIDGVQCLRNVIDGVRPGSIVVFHDSLKAEERLRFTLPRTLEHFTRLGHQFKALDMKPGSRPTASLP